jgi:hypothetical protein
MPYLKTIEGAAPGHAVSIQVPMGLDFQLIFRQVRTSQSAMHAPEGTQFVLVDSMSTWVKASASLRQALGLKGWMLSAAKIQRGRIVYFTRSADVVLHYGWITTSWCRHYRVQPRDVVIGPIWSAERSRGNGVGAYSTTMAMNAMIRRGHSVFFIDTANMNKPCLRMIENCGFGSPVASYLR